MRAAAAACAIALALGALGHAAADPGFFLSEAEEARDRLAPLMADATPGERDIFEEGSRQVEELRAAIDAGDAESAKAAFEAAMGAFAGPSGEEYDARAALVEAMIEKARGLPGGDGAVERAEALAADGRHEEALAELRGAWREGHGGRDAGALLQLAERLRDRLAPGMEGASPGERDIFEEGSRQVEELRAAIDAGDAESAKAAFEAAMGAFKRLAGGLPGGAPDGLPDLGDPAALLERMRTHAERLWAAASRQGVAADLGALDAIFERAEGLISEGRDREALAALDEAKSEIASMRARMSGEISELDLERSLRFAERYVERLDERIPRGAPAPGDEADKAPAESVEAAGEAVEGEQAGTAEADEMAGEAEQTESWTVEDSGAAGAEPDMEPAAEPDAGPDAAPAAEPAAEDPASELRRMLESARADLAEAKRLAGAGDAEGAREKLAEAAAKMRAIKAGLGP